MFLFTVRNKIIFDIMYHMILGFICQVLLKNFFAFSKNAKAVYNAVNNILGGVFVNLDAFIYGGNDLGAVWTAESTHFKLWAPMASAVELVLAPPGPGEEGFENAQIIPMQVYKNGVWAHEVMGDINEYRYLFAVTNDGMRHTLVDPYAKAVGVNGTTGVVLNLAQTNPVGWVRGGMRTNTQSPLDAVIYETHVKDLSSHPSAGIKNAGRFLGFTEHGTRTPCGQKTGLDHLLELGITHVHLLPSFDFFSLDESIVPNPNFNWGYDPLNYNVPEGTYATCPFDPSIRIKEFKEMVMALHKAGIGAIMDVVYNHTGPIENHCFNLVVPHFYHRMTTDGHFSGGSGCGNEIADEHAMVRKYIVDSVKFWVEEYNISGFRFDLMGLHCIDTMNEIRKALDEIDPSIIMYGEGWMGGVSTLPVSQAALKQNAPMVSERIGFFSDDIRDGIKGSVFIETDPGWVSGAFDRKNEVMFGMVAAVRHPGVSSIGLPNSSGFWAKAPTQHITYVSAHDNLTLWDKLKSSCPQATEADLLAMNRMAAAIVLTSQGIPFIHAAEDIARTKFGDENSYKSPDSVNQIRWDTKAKYRELFDYYRGLIALRAKYPAFRMRTAAEIEAHLKFLQAAPQIIAYTLNGDTGMILVAFNAGSEPYALALPINGTWDMVVDGTHAGTEVLARVNGDKITLDARSSYVFMRKM